VSRARDVLFVDHAGVLGGAELSLLDLAVSFGATAEVLLLSDGPFRELLASRGVRVAVEPLGALSRVRKDTRLPPMGALVDAAKVSSRVARRAKAHALLYANSQKAFVVSAAAGLLANRPVVWHLRDILAEPHFSRANIFAATQLANLRAARVIANSQATADAFVAGGGNTQPGRGVPDGVDAFGDDCTEKSCRGKIWSVHVGSLPSLGILGIDLALLKSVCTPGAGAGLARSALASGAPGFAA